MPDDETVNQMIARHEEEFDLFMVSITGQHTGGDSASHPLGCSGSSLGKRDALRRSQAPADIQLHKMSVRAAPRAGSGAGGSPRGGPTMPPNWPMSPPWPEHSGGCWDPHAPPSCSRPSDPPNARPPKSVVLKSLSEGVNVVPYQGPVTHAPSALGGKQISD